MLNKCAVIDVKNKVTISKKNKKKKKKINIGYASHCPGHVHWDQVGTDSTKTGH